jgi:putative transposase
MDQRVQFIADYQRDVFDVAELARRYGISRKTAYKWIDRYDAAGPVGLSDRSRRPAHCPHATSAVIVAALLEVRRHHPTWGAKKLLKIVATQSAICSIARASFRRPGDGRCRPIPAAPWSR